MSLVYATDLALRDRSSHAPASIEAAAAVVGDWAGVDPLIEGGQVGRRGAQVWIEMFDASPASIWLLTFSHPDVQDESLKWDVTVTILSDGQTTSMATRLNQSRPDGSVVGVRTEPRPPACIKRVIEAADICAFDGGTNLSANVWVVNLEEAESLASLILDAERRLPVIAFTPRDDDVVDGGILTERLPGLAHVVFVQSPTAWKLQDLIPKGFGVYGGAARIWWPHIRAQELESSKWNHKLWAGDVSARRIAEECVELVITAGLSAVTIESRVAEIQAERRRFEIARLRSEVESAARSNESARFDIELDRFEKLVKSYEGDVREARERADLAERDRDFWRGECARLRARANGRPEIEEAQEAEVFRREVESEVNGRGVVEGSHRRVFRIGTKFVATMEAHGDRYRAKIVKTCSDVVLAAPDLLRRVDDHVLRTGQGGSDPPRRRDSDGATAKRCYVEQKTPAARRLHYWLLADGSVEFASVNVHDDPSIPGG